VREDGGRESGRGVSEQECWCLVGWEGVVLNSEESAGLGGEEVVVVKGSRAKRERIGRWEDTGKRHAWRLRSME